MNKTSILYAALCVSIFLMIVSAASASGEIKQTADRLNYWNAENHTVTVANTGAASTNVTIAIQSGWSWVSGSTCTQAGSNIECLLSGNSSGTYTIQSPGSSAAEYQTDKFVVATNNTYTGNNVTFLRIKDNEIFHTLVEYGRGRGNYFFDSAYSGKAGSGHTGIGCAYVPNNTLFELNFLHKVLNVKQYFGDLTANAYNATFSCTYPNRSIVRQHLITSTIMNSSGADVSYKIPKIEGSWERMGYLGMDFDANEQNVGENLAINCTNMTYVFPVGGGSFVVDEDSFTLAVRDREPFTASASTTSTIGNGTQEVLITYNITNNEVYTVDDIIIEIQAPEYAAFIGTRGELWGYALDQYRIEKTELLANESEIIMLIVRFDTSSAPNITSINLTKEIKIKYVTCWELNAYNPAEYMQYLYGIGAASVTMGAPASIVSVRTRLEQIYNITVAINTTVTEINTTVNNIKTIVETINATTNETNIIVRAINTTTNSILNQTEIILNNTITIMNDTSFIIDQLDCNGTNDSPLCDKVNALNSTLYEIWNLTLQLNYTAHNLNITLGDINVTGVNITVNIDWTNLTNQLYDIKSYINCTNVTGQPNTSVCIRLERIENLTGVVNNTIQTLYNTTLYFNTTVFGNLTFQDILDAIGNATVDTSDVLNSLKEVREFQEEVVFLITDSFNFQQQARDDFLKGDVVSAADKLMKANSRLIASMDLMLSGQERLVGEERALFGLETNKWIWIGIVFIFVMIIAVYLFGRVPPEKYQRIGEIR